jgi:hypothetical protein
MRREGCALGVIAVAVCLFASPATGIGSPTGDPATIVFYKHVASAYRNVPAVMFTVRGNFWYSASGNAFSFYDGIAHPVNAKAATESILTLLSGGLMTKAVISARSPGLPSLTIVQDSSGTWAALQNRPGACFYRQPAQAVSARVHKPFLQVFGKFAPLQKRGSHTLVTSTYAWSKTGTATEVDTIAAATDAILSSQYTVSGPAAHTFTTTYRSLSRAPRFVLAPEPHC